MLLENKNYVTKNGKEVFNIINRKTITDENLKEYYFDWLKRNKNQNIKKSDMVLELSSSVKFPFAGVMYSKTTKQWILTNWMLDGRYDSIKGPNDLDKMFN